MMMMMTFDVDDDVDDLLLSDVFAVKFLAARPMTVDW